MMNRTVPIYNKAAPKSTSHRMRNAHIKNPSKKLAAKSIFVHVL